MPAGVDEVAGQGQFIRVAGEPVQLGQGQLDQRVPAHAVAAARAERRVQLGHGAPGGGDQPVVVAGAHLGHRGLGQRPDVEDLVVDGQVTEAVGLGAGDLFEGVEVAVAVLGVADQAGDLALPGGELRVLGPGLLPGQRLQPLVDLAVLVDRAVILAVRPAAAALKFSKLPAASSLV